MTRGRGTALPLHCARDYGLGRPLVLRGVVRIALAHADRAVKLLLERRDPVGACAIARDVVEFVWVVAQVVQFCALGRVIAPLGIAPILGVDRLAPRGL